MTAYPRFLVALGGGDEVGASAYLLQVDGKRVLVDAGLRLRGGRVLPDFAYVSQLGMLGLWQCDCVCLTHAHLDHSGALPALHEKAPGTPLHTTPPTKDIAAILLHDTIKITRKRGGFMGDVRIEKYTQEATQDALGNLIEHPFAQPFEAAADIRVTFFPAGHIIGAAMVLVEIGDFRALFSGDFCSDGQLTVHGYRLPDALPPVDLMVCESTYAYREHESNETLARQQQQLVDQVVQAVSRGGKVLIPAFAVGRAQEILTLFRQVFSCHQVDPFPVWSDGMVNQVCRVYNQYRSYLRADPAESDGDILFDAELSIQPVPHEPGAPGFDTLLDKQPPCCIVASSGMLADGSRSAAYASRLIGGKRNRILFTGYLDEESPGQGLLKAIVGKRKFRLNGREYTVQADVHQYHLSAHANLSQIVDLVEQVKPKEVVFVHGQSDRITEDNLFSCLHHLERRGIHPVMARNNRQIVL